MQAHSNQSRTHGRTIFLVVIASLLGGGLPVLIKFGLTTMEPVSYSLSRYVVATLALALLGLWRGERFFKDTQIRLLAVPALGNFLNIVLFAFGVQQVSATLAQVLYLLTPVIVCVSTFFLLGERMTQRQVSGMVIATVGAAAAVQTRGEMEGSLWGIAIMLLAVISYSGYVVSAKRLSRQFSSFQQTFGMSAFVAMGLALILPIFEENPRVLPISYQEGLSLFYSGVLGSAIFYLLIQEILKTASTILAMVPVYLQPILAGMWSNVIFGERPTPIFAAAGFLTILGAFLVTLPATPPRTISAN